MSRTEDEIARDLRSGAMSVEGVTAEFERGDVLVYNPADLGPTATWDEAEANAVSTSGLFAALMLAGASEEQMDHIGMQIERLRVQGRTFP